MSTGEPAANSNRETALAPTQKGDTLGRRFGLRTANRTNKRRFISVPNTLERAGSTAERNPQPVVRTLRRACVLNLRRQPKAVCHVSMQPPALQLQSVNGTEPLSPVLARCLFVATKHVTLSGVRLVSVHLNLSVPGTGGTSLTDSAPYLRYLSSHGTHAPNGSYRAPNGIER